MRKAARNASLNLSGSTTRPEHSSLDYEWHCRSSIDLYRVMGNAPTKLILIRGNSPGDSFDLGCLHFPSSIVITDSNRARITLPDCARPAPRRLGSPDSSSSLVDEI